MTVSVNGGAAQTIALTPATNANCVVVASGGTRCTNLTVQAPVGSDTFALILYAGVSPSSSVVASYTTPAVTVAAGVSNNLGTYTLDPVVASYTISTPWVWTAGQAISYPLIVTATDASGATIIGPGDYVDSSGTPTPINLTLTTGGDGGEGAFMIGTTPLDGSPQAPSASGGTLYGPGDVATIYYSGAASLPWSLGTTGPNPTAAGIALSPAISPIYQTGQITIGPSFENNSISVGSAGPAAPYNGPETGYTFSATATCSDPQCTINIPFAQAGFIEPYLTSYPGTANRFAASPSFDCPPGLMVQPYVNGTTAVGVSVSDLDPRPVFVGGCHILVFGGGGQTLSIEFGANFNP